MSDNKISYFWEDVGRLEIDVENNRFATVRFQPSAKTIIKTLDKLSKNASNQRISDLHKFTPTDFKGENNVIMDKYGDDSVLSKKSFSELSILSHEHLKTGRLDLYVDDILAMSEVLRMEGKNMDELKLLLVAFYIKLSGCVGKPTADIDIVNKARVAVELSSLSKNDIKNLFYDTVTIRITPKHIMTIAGVYRLFDMMLSGKSQKATRIVNNLSNVT